MIAGIVYAVLSGLSFALIAVAFRWAQDRSVRPIIVSTSLGLFGAVAFATQCRGDWLSAPIRVWVAAVASGSTQYLMARLIRAALRRGPVASFWCAANLGFLVVVAYSSACLREAMGAMQVAAVAAGVAGVVAASFTGGKGAVRSIRQGSRLAYALILAGLLLTSGVMGSAIKDLSVRVIADDGGTMLTVHGNTFFVVAYGVLGLLGAADVAAGGGLHATFRQVLPVGLLAGVATTVGMFFLALAAPHPAAVVFTVSSATSILFASSLSLVLFRERPTPAWCATVAFTTLALLLGAMT